jgi:hypothetical protein
MGMLMPNTFGQSRTYQNVILPYDARPQAPKLYSFSRPDSLNRMPTTRLYFECPNCHMQYHLKKGALYYSNGAYIENVAGAPEWQRLLCPCRPETPHKFKLSETTRLQIFSDDDEERTHFSPRKN